MAFLDKFNPAKSHPHEDNDNPPDFNKPTIEVLRGRLKEKYDYWQHLLVSQVPPAEQEQKKEEFQALFFRHVDEEMPRPSREEYAQKVTDLFEDVVATSIPKKSMEQCQEDLRSLRIFWKNAHEYAVDMHIAFEEQKGITQEIIEERKQLRHLLAEGGVGELQGFLALREFEHKIWDIYHHRNPGAGEEIQL